MAVSRRDFVQRVGAAGGYAAAYVTLQALGFLKPAQAFAAGPPDLAAARGGGGAKVVILGAGVAGMAAAYELGRAGYDCTVLEARPRAGGRNWTVRRGSVIELTDGSRQVCDFDEGQYFNAGPARLPSHHQAVLGYCRELGVALEVEINTNRSALLLNPEANGGKPIRLRQAVNDTRGHVSELLCKAINRGALDQELTAEDKARMVAFLKQYGDLNPDLFYRGSERSGLKTLPGAGDERSSAYDPLSLGLLLDEDMWSGVLFEEVIDMQAVMFQPVGGMDRIPAAFERVLGPKVRLGMEVRKLRRTRKGVRVVCRDRASGRDVTVEAQYCICTVPPPVLRGIDADFSPAHRAAIARVPYGDAIKVAWQAPRFWEAAPYRIYGGISFVRAANALVWYPSHDLHSKTGVLLGAYATGPAAERMAALSRTEQIDLTRRMIDQLHPGAGALLTKPLQVRWAEVPYNLGPWSQWPSDHEPDYALLSEPDGPFWFAGEHLSHVGAWQEGSIRSAHRAAAQLDARHREGRPVTAARLQ